MAQVAEQHRAQLGAYTRGQVKRHAENAVATLEGLDYSTWELAIEGVRYARHHLENAVRTLADEEAALIKKAEEEVGLP